MMPVFISVLDDPDERELFSQVFLDYHRLMLYEASKYIADAHAKEDVVQNALLKAIEHSADLKEMERRVVPYWLVTITRNESINYLRRESVIAKHSGGTVDEELDSLMGGQSGEELAEQMDCKSAIGRIWPKLKRSEQILLSGRYVLGYSDFELAEVLGCREDSVRMMLTRARRHAASVLREEGITIA